jgi:hypothetical protein
MGLDRRQGTRSTPPSKASGGTVRPLPPPHPIAETRDFERAYEEAFAQLREHVEEVAATETGWPLRAAAAIRAVIRFAVDNPDAARTLTNRALAQGAEHNARYKRLVDYMASILAAGRDEELRRGTASPELLEEALAGGIFMLIGGRLERGGVADLAEVGGETVEFALTPYLGGDEARRVAAVSRRAASGAHG